MRSQRVHHLVAHLGRLSTTECGDIARPEIARHDYDGIAEVDRSALSISQTTIIQQLQQDVEDIRVRLFDFVEENHAVRPTTYRFRQLTAFVIADVAWRRTNQTADGVLLHVLGHVDAHHRLLVVEQEFGERSRQFGFTDTGRAEEDERTKRLVWIGKTRPRSPDRVRDR